MRDLKYIIGIVLIAFLVVSGIFNFRKKVQLRRRQDDVKSLSSVYLQMAADTTNHISYENLVTQLKRKGITLHNPIPSDPTKPCYGISPFQPDKPQRFLVWETNTTDTNLLVLGLFDGSVAVLSQSQLSKVVAP